jgi:hypothetical protein
VLRYERTIASGRPRMSARAPADSALGADWDTASSQSVQNVTQELAGRLGFPGTNPAARRPVLVGWQSWGYSVISRRYLRRQASTLIKFAKSTNNPELAAVLIEKAANLKSRVEERAPAPDTSLRAPDVEPPA